MVLIIDDILRFPLDLSVKVLESIRDAADKELLKTPENIKSKFMEIQIKYENGELEKDEYEAYVKFLEKKLEEIGR